MAEQKKKEDLIKYFGENELTIQLFPTGKTMTFNKWEKSKNFIQLELEFRQACNQGKVKIVYFSPAVLFLIVCLINNNLGVSTTAVFEGKKVDSDYIE